MSTPVQQQTLSQRPVDLQLCTSEDLRNYFINSWELYDLLFGSIVDQRSFYTSPDPLRNPLIFYWGHTAAFYINKLLLAGLLHHGINPYFEEIFAKGVDPDLPENLSAMEIWPSVEEVNVYRENVFQTVLKVIDGFENGTIIDKHSPWWSLLMGIEHDRIHLETSSVLLRQLPEKELEKPERWVYADSHGLPPKNNWIEVPAGQVILGKPSAHSEYGWDNEFGQAISHVNPFKASQNLISNYEYLAFVESGNYNNPSYWTDEGLQWKLRVGSRHPKFWEPSGRSFLYRTLFELIEMPLDWPVEVNSYEAQAYCNWKGQGIRLLKEVEFKRIWQLQGEKVSNNINFSNGSPSRVGDGQESPTAFNDLSGNVWDWLQDDFHPLPGFKSHSLYKDFSAPYFDSDHGMLLGGSWITTGTAINPFYRLWFRRYFYQHAGFRLASDL